MAVGNLGKSYRYDVPAWEIITKNPWNLERTPGGSSGGASAAVAAGPRTKSIRVSRR